MSTGTKIEWTHRPGTIPASMNAIVGCKKVSEGCRNCYATGQSHRFAGVVGDKRFATTKREGGKTVWTGQVNLDEKALLAPLSKRKPHTYFVNSMSDLFYEGVSDEVIDRHFAVFALCPQHTFIVLTKRPERMRAYLTHADRQDSIAAKGGAFEVEDAIPLEKYADRSHFKDATGVFRSVFSRWPLPNVWGLVSVENQPTADTRIPLLLQTPLAVRGVSCEPLLGSVDLASKLGGTQWIGGQRGCDGMHRGVGSAECPRELHHHHDERCAQGLDWVICGGESGHGARPMHPDWARGLRDQCVAAGVPFFFKQWGEWAPRHSLAAGRGDTVAKPWHIFDPDESVCKVGKKAAGHLLDGVEHHAFPEVR